MKAAKTHIIVHSFALLHVLTAISCRLVGIPDEYLLTLLTITMVVLICGQRDMRMEISSSAIVFGNLAAYLLGLAIANAISLLELPELLTFPLSTLITTEALGWLIYGLTFLFEKSSTEISRRQVIWLALTCGVVYLVRVILCIFHDRGLFGRIGNSEGVFYFLFSFCAMTILVAATLIGYAASQRRRTRKEKEKRHLAQFRYMRLNQQVNPHFLFNSLNVLDCLVLDGENEKASTYIHKLSSLYRYMLSNEDEVIVKLREEMEYVNQYMDLMKVRFPEGLEIETSLPEEMMGAGIVPCSVQLLIENATKHNAINKANPLVIRIAAKDSGHIVVSNNLCPKLTPVNSTGKGLKYIRQQFKDISGQDIEVSKTKTDYSVTLPLL